LEEDIIAESSNLSDEEKLRMRIDGLRRMLETKEKESKEKDVIINEMYEKTRQVEQKLKKMEENKDKRWPWQRGEYKTSYLTLIQRTYDKFFVGCHPEKKETWPKDRDIDRYLAKKKIYGKPVSKKVRDVICTILKNKESIKGGRRPLPKQKIQ